MPAFTKIASEPLFHARAHSRRGSVERYAVRGVLPCPQRCGDQQNLQLTFARKTSRTQYACSLGSDLLRFQLKLQSTNINYFGTDVNRSPVAGHFDHRWDVCSKSF